MRNLVFAAAILAVLAPSALADYNAGYVHIDRVTNYYSGSGGEFRINPTRRTAFEQQYIENFRFRIAKNSLHPKFEFYSRNYGSLYANLCDFCLVLLFVW